MTHYIRTIAQILIATQLITHAIPARADTVQDIIIQQQKDECRQLGGRYEYPKCYLPQESPKQAPTDDAWCDWNCKLIIGLIGAAAARAAYCKANPDKC